MKNLILSFSLIMLVMGGQTAHAQATLLNQVSNGRISVTGEAEVRVVPDQVIISLTAESRGSDLLATQKKNEASVAGLIEYATKKADVADKHIQTDYTSVEPTYRRCDYDDELEGRCNPLQITYYKVRKGIQIRLNNLENYEDLITKALQLGITHIDNIQFITTELRKHRDKARELAAKASQEKAQALAGTLGMKLGKPVSINANHWTNYYRHGYGQRGHNQMMQNVIQSVPSGGGSSGGDAMALGQINIKAQVHVSYSME